MTSGSNDDLPSVLDENMQVHNGNLEDRFESELDWILREQRHQSFIERENDLNIYRSGSAPPTVEGSLNAVGSLSRNYDLRDIDANSSNNNGVFSEDAMLSHPAYLSYYYSNENNNPRLPPPFLSKEDWRATQRFQAEGSPIGGIGDRRKRLVDDGNSSLFCVQEDWRATQRFQAEGSPIGGIGDRRQRLVDDGNSSLFCVQPTLSVQEHGKSLIDLTNSSGRNLSRQPSSDWKDRSSDSLISISSNRLGERRKSFADVLQEGLDKPCSVPGQLSRPSSRNAFGDLEGGDDSKIPDLSNVAGTDLQDGSAAFSLSGFQSHGRPVPQSFAAAVGSSLSRSTTPEAQLIGRAPSPSLPPVGSRVYTAENKHVSASKVQNGYSSYIEQLNVAYNLAGLSLSSVGRADEEGLVQPQLGLEIDNQSDYLFNLTNSGGHSLQQQIIDDSTDQNFSFPSDYVDLARKNGILRTLNASSLSSNERVNLPRRTSSSANLYSKVGSPGFGFMEGSDIHRSGNLNALINNQIDAGCGLDGSGKGKGHMLSGLQSPFVQPSYAKFLPGTSEFPSYGGLSPGDISQVRDYPDIPQGDLDGFQKAYLRSLIAEQKQQYDLSLLEKSRDYNHKHYGNPSSGLGNPYLGELMTNSRLPTIGPGAPMLQNERILHYNSMTRNSMGGSIGLWPSDVGNYMAGGLGSSLLDEFKSNKSRSFELSDIVDHVVEFSMDQYGSRFIQQKLETAKLEEKNQIFLKIIPHARAFTTDVFGNYVIQKLFEHGTENQIKELACQLTGLVLPLSLQMYGCRVIQKALEVVDVDQQTQMVAELDGTVMKCVRDQNGNHVIQKCIECVPQDRIQFIISAFYGQVVSLSTHPYGCRVIQRVLEHCGDLNTQRVIMDEIMQSVCSLSQDRYGNYVIQHVLEHGQPLVRSAIITKLAGQIVKMSQQKFASNVVEKCLTFGSHEERQILVKEILGSTDENEPLQLMMKDPFGNYVVQKVLETCDNQNLELILSRIRIHLNTLKIYTYGKHIVARVEKLIATGEKRIKMASSAHSQDINPN